MPKVNSLSDLGFIKNYVFEVIVSTYGVDHKPNAAPMGVMSDDMNRLIIKPYTTTQTYRNILLRKCAVINITSDPVIYSKTAFKGENPDNRVPIDWFEKADLIDAPKLKMVDACIEVRTIEIESAKGDRAKVLCEVVKIAPIVNITPKAYCRATFALIESIIQATRIEVFLSKDEKEKAEELIKLVKYYDALVKRVAPSSVYLDIMKGILKRIEAWKVKREL